MGKQLRADRTGSHRLALANNRKRILATEDHCALCGRPVDKTLKAPHPMSACIDHIVPIAKGGHPSALDNLQLAHWTCNRQKSDKILGLEKEGHDIGNRLLPQSLDWSKYRAE